MKRRSSVVMTLLTALLLLTAASSAAPAWAQSSESAAPPFTEGATPSGWTWWCDEENTTCVMLPDGTAGTQKRFLLVTKDVASVVDTKAGWFGGGEVAWDGAVETTTGAFEGQILTNGTARGLVGTSDQWAFAAIGLEDAWESTADVYNTVLRGGDNE